MGVREIIKGLIAPSATVIYSFWMGSAWLMARCSVGNVVAETDKMRNACWMSGEEAGRRRWWWSHIIVNIFNATIRAQLIAMVTSQPLIPLGRLQRGQIASRHSRSDELCYGSQTAVQRLCGCFTPSCFSFLLGTHLAPDKRPLGIDLKRTARICNMKFPLNTWT